MTKTRIYKIVEKVITPYLFFSKTVFSSAVTLFWFASAFLFITTAAAFPNCHKLPPLKF